MTAVPPDKLSTVIVQKSFYGLKLAQIIQLVKDNQLLTAAVLFILWQIGFIADASSYVGGMC